MIRQIIEIDDELCNVCGNCITGCAEGALQLVNGKAKLVKENFCDGFGDCIGTCPTGALTIIERDVAEFDENAVKTHLMETQGAEAVWRMEEAQKKHDQKDQQIHMHSGCPGSKAMVLEKDEKQAAVSSNASNAPVLPSDLAQWPVQIHLVPPTAPYFQNKELVVMSTCVPLASADVHWRYLRGRSVVVGCPKLDDTTPYVSRLGAIFKENNIPKVIIARMEVPCCGGLTMIVQDAVQFSGRADLVIEEHVISIDGSIKRITVLEQ